MGKDTITDSTKKSTLPLTASASAKLIWLPSLLAVSLMISACNNTADVQKAETTASNEASADVASEAMVAETIDPAVETNDATPEDLMIDNLARYRWTLNTAMDSSNKPLTALMAIKDQVTLSFNMHQAQNALSYSVGCNTMSATYQLKAQTISIEDSMSTKMSCDDLNLAENQLNGLMQGDSQLSLTEGEAPSLTQVTSDATTLVWTGKMTAQAKYNSNGDTVFWAINAKSLPCSDNKAQVCLQIKPITYDEQGIKTDEGELVEFAGVIDGYQHDATQDVVLRMQRFKTNVDTVLVDNIDSQYAYVLDTVIESSIAK